MKQLSEQDRQKEPLYRIIWKKALELGFQFNETDSAEMAAVVSKFAESENAEYELNRKINLELMAKQEQEIDRLKAEREKEIL